MAIALPIAIVCSAILALAYDALVAPALYAPGLNFVPTRDIPRHDWALFAAGVVAALLSAPIVVPFVFRPAGHPTVLMALCTYTIGVLVVPVAEVLVDSPAMGTTATLVIFYALSPIAYVVGLPVLACLFSPAHLWVLWLRRADAR